ncbi:carbonic anhydrase [Enterobacter hormaechei]
MVPELVTQQEPGQLFVIRNAGNIAPPFGPAWRCLCDHRICGSGPGRDRYRYLRPLQLRRDEGDC